MADIRQITIPVKNSSTGVITKQTYNLKSESVPEFVDCSTARSTAAKKVTISGFSLTTGAHIFVRFTDTGTSNPSSGNLSLEVNSTGAKTIIDGHTNNALTYSSAGYFYNNYIAEFLYDGTNWVYLNRDSTYNGSNLRTSTAQSGTAQSSVASSIAANTSVDSVVGTLLKNDATLNQAVKNEAEVRGAISAKNLYNLSVIGNGTDAGISYTFDKDGVITLGGGTITSESGAFQMPPAQSVGSLDIHDRLKPSTEYIFSIENSLDNMVLYVYYQPTSSDTWQEITHGSAGNPSVRFTTPSSFYRLWIVVMAFAGTIPANFKMYPMVRLASDNDDTYQPFAKTNKELTEDSAQKSDLASISIRGTTNNTGAYIDKDIFFYLNGTLVKSKNVISNGATLTKDTNYEVVTAGALNNMPMFKSISFGTSKQSSSTLTFAGGVRGLLFCVGPTTTMQAMYCISVTSEGQVRCDKISSSDTGSQVGISIGSYTVTITNNNTGNGLACGVTMISGRTPTVN